MARRAFCAVGEVEALPVELTPQDLFELGLRYCVGRDVESDLIEAHKWFNLAALRGNCEARRCRAEIADDMTRSEVFKAQRLARQWLRLH